MDTQRIEAAVRELLLAIGEDPEREGLQETPRRVAAMYTEVFSGLEEDPHAHVKIFHEDSPDEMVTVRDIPLYSMCEHHPPALHRGGAHRLYSQRRPGDWPVQAGAHRQHLRPPAAAAGAADRPGGGFPGKGAVAPGGGGDY